MKKIVSILLTLCALICVCAPAGAAAAESAKDYPVIIVPGYGASPLFLQNEDGSLGEQVWGWNIFMDGLLDQLKQKFPAVLTGAVLLTLGSAKQIGATLGQAAIDMLGKLAFNGSGESVYNITTLPNDPALCRWDLFEANFDGDLYSEKEIGRVLDDYVPESQIFNFAVDFRYGAVHNAEKLDEFIGKVKEYTGKDKVNLYAVSHGGQVTAAYLHLFGDKKDVFNAVLTVPAIGGSYVAYDVLTGNLAFDEEELLVFIENALYLEQDFEWLLKMRPLSFVDDILAAMLPGLKQVAGLWESLWDFLPPECLQSAVDTVNAEECAGLIAKTTDFHNNIMANIGESLRAARDNGVNVNIVAGTGSAIVTGSQQNSDAIIHTSGATGAKVAPLGKRFSNGYTCGGSVCTDPAHNHLSPSMEIDATYAYLPENTWFVDGMFHGMTMNEPYARSLAMKLLFTDELADVHTDPAYPQFRASENMAYAVYGEFTNSPSGYIDSGSTVYRVTNRSDAYEMRILSVYADGLDVRFEGDYKNTIAPGESADFNVVGDIPAVSAARAAVTVTFELKKSYTPLNFRTFRYTVNNGAPALYDPAAPFADRDFTPPVAALMTEKTAGLLTDLGLMDWFSMWFNILLRMLMNLRSVFVK